ncbi:MAG: hypothetical protein M1546_01000 [Chloroflexi bacterium]|nr:hypothetical protein [Chloroflexota bacterium]
MRVKIESGEIHLTNLHTRMPFRYGIATVTALPHLFLRLSVVVDEVAHNGIAADHLPPKWFTKEPGKDVGVEISEMLRVIEHALQLTCGTSADSPFDAWLSLYHAQARWGAAEQLAPLLTNFGVSLVERALIDAVCRATGRPFALALRTNTLGIRLGELHDILKDNQPADFLPAQPLRQMTVRHTVGLSDPIDEAEITPADRLDDGLPQSLTACIDAYGLHHFKIKVNGNLERDVERLARVAAVIEQRALPNFAFSLDGNEQFKSLAQLQQFWEAVRRHAGLQGFLRHLLFVEQPFHRDTALDATALSAMRDWPDRPPLIIDESDATFDSLPQALRLGYNGTSHKNCKGIFKGIANCCLLEHTRRNQPAGYWIMSGEDLSNIGPVALMQDLAVQATLGIQSIERNGHHYFTGLSMFPTEIQRQVLAAHGDLYHQHDLGWPALTISDGSVCLDSVVTAPFGVQFELDVQRFTPIQDWHMASSYTER